MKRRMALGDFIVALLHKIGVQHMFGIPGDLVLKLFFRFGKARGLKILTFSHEPGVGFAADAYARATGRIGVICVTYGAGGHNMVNPVAGSFAERVPVLIFSGGPGEEERKLGTLIHHQAREIESQLRIYREVTCASWVVTNPQQAAYDVYEVVRKVWEEQRPGYLEIHRDMVDSKIEVPREIIEWDGNLAFPSSDSARLREAVRETARMFNQARRPVLLVGIETHRFKLGREVVRLAEKMGVPVLTTVLGKGAFPMDHPQYMGVHIGSISPAPIVRRMDEADLIIGLGCLKTDMNFGNRPPHLAQERTIWATQGRIDIRYHAYVDVTLRDFVHALLREDLRSRRENVEYADNLQPVSNELKQRPIRVADLLRTVNEFLADKHRYAVVAESGDMLFAGLDIRTPRDSTYFAQGYYASMGFSVPAALGVQVGSGLRPLVLCGDGSFQMTGPEISHAPALGLNPIVVVVDNGGWGIFRPVAERPDLLKIPPWPYAQLGEQWGGRGFAVTTVAELREALEAAHRLKSFSIIQVPVPHSDLSPVTLKYIRAAAQRSRPSR